MMFMFVLWVPVENAIAVMFMFVLWVPVENHCCDVYVCSLGSCGEPLL